MIDDLSGEFSDGSAGGNLRRSWFFSHFRQSWLIWSQRWSNFTQDINARITRQLISDLLSHDQVAQQKFSIFCVLDAQSLMALKSPSSATKRILQNAPSEALNRCKVSFKQIPIKYAENFALSRSFSLEWNHHNARASLRIKSHRK